MFGFENAWIKLRKEKRKKDSYSQLQIETKVICKWNQRFHHECKAKKLSKMKKQGLCESETMMHHLL